jgi:predicted AlkP superfamily pyrophosphatase or phosphodiesterase
MGPGDPRAANDVRQVDALCGDLIAFYEARGCGVIVLSEYGLCDVTTPVHPNRVLREHGLLAIREELGLELLDPGASAAFAVADHQVAHVYVNDPAQRGKVRSLLEGTPGVERVLDAEGKAALRIDHPRAGDLVAIADPRAWFTYYYWLDDARAPDFARTVDIHRKPGYDPVELVLDPAIRMPPLTIGWKLAKKSLGFRMLMDVIPLDASLVRGSHGRPGRSDEHGPLLISRRKHLLGAAPLASVDVHDVILEHLGVAHAG